MQTNRSRNLVACGARFPGSCYMAEKQTGRNVNVGRIAQMPVLPWQPSDFHESHCTVRLRDVVF